MEASSFPLVRSSSQLIILKWLDKEWQYIFVCFFEYKYDLRLQNLCLLVPTPDCLCKRCPTGSNQDDNAVLKDLEQDTILRQWYER